MEKTFLIRCKACKALNKVLKKKLDSRPICGNCKTLLKIPSRIIDISGLNFQDEVILWPGTVLVDFFSPSCGFCNQLNPILDKIAYEKRGALKIVRVNTLIDQELAMQYGIRGVPTLILFEKGKKVTEITGFMQKEKLDAWINRYIY